MFESKNVVLARESLLTVKHQPLKKLDFYFIT